MEKLNVYQYILVVLSQSLLSNITADNISFAKKLQKSFKRKEQVFYFNNTDILHLYSYL